MDGTIITEELLYNNFNPSVKKKTNIIKVFPNLVSKEEFMENRNIMDQATYVGEIYYPH